MYMIVVREHCPGRGLSLRTVVDGTRFGNETVRFYCVHPLPQCAHYHPPPHNPSYTYITLPTKHRTVSLVSERPWPQTHSLTRFGHFLAHCRSASSTYLVRVLFRTLCCAGPLIFETNDHNPTVPYCALLCPTVPYCTLLYPTVTYCNLL